VSPQIRARQLTLIKYEMGTAQIDSRCEPVVMPPPNPLGLKTNNAEPSVIAGVLNLRIPTENLANMLMVGVETIGQKAQAPMTGMEKK